MAFKIQMGGFIRWPFNVNTATSEEWNAGMLVILDSSTLKLNEITGISNADKVIGVVVESKLETTGLTSVAGSGFTANQTKGSGKASLVLSPAVIETDQLASGLQFTAGERLYTNNAGKWTNSASTDKRCFGQALSTVHSNAAGSPKLVILYNPMAIAHP